MRHCNCYKIARSNFYKSLLVGCLLSRLLWNIIPSSIPVLLVASSVLSAIRFQILQCLLNICGDYAAEHEITFNCNKTIGVLFCPKKYKQPAPSNVFLNGVRVQFFDQVKYFGVWINASLKDDDDIQRQVKSLYCAANKLRRTFDQCSPAVKKHFIYTPRPTTITVARSNTKCWTACNWAEAHSLPTTGVQHYWWDQGGPTTGPQAACSPPRHFLWPAEAFRKNCQI